MMAPVYWRLWYLKGFGDVNRQAVQSEYMREIFKAQLRWILDPSEPIDGPYLQGYADGLSSAFGA
jgi:hypothetical protein